MSGPGQTRTAGDVLARYAESAVGSPALNDSILGPVWREVYRQAGRPHGVIPADEGYRMSVLYARALGAEMRRLCARFAAAQLFFAMRFWTPGLIGRIGLSFDEDTSPETAPLMTSALRRIAANAALLYGRPAPKGYLTLTGDEIPANQQKRFARTFVALMVLAHTYRYLFGLGLRQTRRLALVEWRGIPEGERDTLIERLNLARTVDENGGAHFNGEPFFDDVVGVLEAALRFPDEIPETEARRAVSAALFDGGTEAVDAEGMKRKIEERVAAFLDADPSPYVLVSSFSARYFEGLEETEVAGCRLAFHRSVPEPFAEGHRWAQDWARTRVPGRYGPMSFFWSRYTYVTVEAEGRSETEAGVRALKALDVQRAIWNLALLHLRAPGPGGSHPLNHVLLGPVHSLHRSGGEVLRWPVWYEPEYVGPVEVFQSRRLEQLWEGVREYEALAREGLSGSLYGPTVEGFLRDYVRVLDGRDPEAAFVRLWGLLERLVGLAESDRHTDVRDRAAFLVRSELRTLQYWVLEALRWHRNAGVHKGILPSDARDLLQQLRRFVVLAIEFHLDEHFGFSDPQEAAKFISQPSEADRLRQRIRSLERQGHEDDLRLARMAMEYHGHAT